MKLLLLFIILLTPNCSFGQSKKFTAKAYSFSNDNRQSKWRDCEIPIIWEIDSGLVKISSFQQIFYLKMSHFDFDSVKIGMANSIDKNNLKMVFKFIEFKEGCSFMEITYSNLQYIYEVKEEENELLTF